MTLDAMYVAVGRTAVVLSGVPVVLAAINFRALSPALRMLCGWLAFGFAVNVAIAVSGSQGKKTTMITQLTFPFFAALAMRAIGLLSGSPTVRRWCTIATVGYLVFWGYRYLQAEASRDFSVFTGPVLWIMLTVAPVVLIIVRLAQSPPSPLRDPGLLTGLAVLLLLAPGAALEPVSGALYEKHRDLVVALWLARASLQVIAYLLFAMVFYWTLPPRSSPGFSSSAA